MTIINEIGELAISTRLMRLSETLRKDVTLIYKEHGLDFESKWFPVLYVMMEKSPISVIELADEIGYSHPSVIALVKEMEKKKLVSSVSCKVDGRKRLLSLTPKALIMREDLQPLWDNLLKAAKKISNNANNLFQAIEETELLLNEESFYQRYKKIEVKNSKPK